MPGLLADGVRWLPGGTPLEALRSLRRVGRQDVCHAHMTSAEGVATVGIPLHRAPIVSTRHFAARRGSSRAGRATAPLIAAGLSREIAVSEFVARRLERKPDAVLRNGVPGAPDLWSPSSRVVLLLQRLDAEKDTLTGLRAWEASRMWEEGWSLRVAGDGESGVRSDAGSRTGASPGSTSRDGYPTSHGSSRRQACCSQALPANRSVSVWSRRWRQGSRSSQPPGEATRNRRAARGCATLPGRRFRSRGGRAARAPR